MFVNLPYDLRTLSITGHDFCFPSFFHGIGHTLRVSIFSAMIGQLTGHDKEGQKAAVAALFHDMARNSDNIDTLHGKRAAKYVVPKYKEYILSLGFSEDDIREMQCAIEWHCYDEELLLSHPYSLTTYLLKDADALDRIRINALDPQYLRLADETIMTEMAKSFYAKMLRYIKKMYPNAAMTHSACEDIINWLYNAENYSLLLKRLEVYNEETIRSIMESLESPIFYHNVLFHYDRVRGEL